MSTITATSAISEHFRTPSLPSLASIPRIVPRSVLPFSSVCEDACDFAANSTRRWAREHRWCALRRPRHSHIQATQGRSCAEGHARAHTCTHLHTCTHRRTRTDAHGRTNAHIHPSSCALSSCPRKAGQSCLVIVADVGHCELIGEGFGVGADAVGEIQSRIVLGQAVRGIMSSQVRMRVL